jgi:two-component system, NarL family, nitrate/nitrite response regulator NarL
MTGGPPYRVLLVEDHRVVAEGLAALLDDDTDLQVVGWVETVADAARLSLPEPVEVVVADYWLSDGTGVEAVGSLRTRWPDAAVLFLSVDDSDEAMLAALEVGAAGYLVKSAGGADVISAVRRAAEGEILVPPHRLAALLTLRRERAERSRRLDSLTPREREILSLMAEGMDNRQVAQRLHVSYATVRSHVRHLLGKLGARSKLEAVVRAVDWGLPERGPYSSN